jgi:hypothetical protein
MILGLHKNPETVDEANTDTLLQKFNTIEQNNLFEGK